MSMVKRGVIGEQDTPHDGTDEPGSKTAGDLVPEKRKQGKVDDLLSRSRPADRLVDTVAATTRQRQK